MHDGTAACKSKVVKPQVFDNSTRVSRAKQKLNSTASHILKGRTAILHRFEQT